MGFLHPPGLGAPAKTKLAVTRGFEPNKRVSDTGGPGLAPALSLANCNMVTRKLPIRAWYSALLLWI